MPSLTMVNCSSLTTATTPNVTTTILTQNMTSTEEPYDAEGAMKFTIAVVLVYGIGVIGLLGIYARRRISEELSDKEASEFFKQFDRQRYRMERLHFKTVAQRRMVRFLSQAANTRLYRVRGSLRPTSSEPALQMGESLLWREDGQVAGDKQCCDLPGKVKDRKVKSSPDSPLTGQDVNKQGSVVVGEHCDDLDGVGDHCKDTDREETRKNEVVFYL